MCEMSFHDILIFFSHAVRCAYYLQEMNAESQDTSFLSVPAQAYLVKPATDAETPVLIIVRNFAMKRRPGIGAFSMAEGATQLKFEPLNVDDPYVAIDLPQGYLEYGKKLQVYMNDLFS